jgi:hypothetical protein
VAAAGSSGTDEVEMGVPYSIRTIAYPVLEKTSILGIVIIIHKIIWVY